MSLQATILVFQALAQYQVASPQQLELDLDVSVLLPRRASAITYRIENRNALVARSAEVLAPVVTVTVRTMVMQHWSPCWSCPWDVPVFSASFHVPGQSCPLAMASAVLVPSLSPPRPVPSVSYQGLGCPCHIPSHPRLLLSPLFL